MVDLKTTSLRRHHSHANEAENPPKDAKGGPYNPLQYFDQHHHNYIILRRKVRKESQAATRLSSLHQSSHQSSDKQILQSATSTQDKSMEALMTIRSGTPSQLLMRLMMLCALPSLTSGFYFQAINGLWQICETRHLRLIAGYLDDKGMYGIVVLEILITVGSVLGTLCFGFLPISVHRMTLISAICSGYAVLGTCLAESYEEFSFLVFLFAWTDAMLCTATFYILTLSPIRLRGSFTLVFFQMPRTLGAMAGCLVNLASLPVGNLKPALYNDLVLWRWCLAMSPIPLGIFAFYHRSLVCCSIYTLIQDGNLDDAKALLALLRQGDSTQEFATMMAVNQKGCLLPRSIRHSLVHSEAMKSSLVCGIATIAFSGYTIVNTIHVTFFPDLRRNMLPAVALTVLPVSLVLCTFFGGVISLVATSKITIKSCFLVTAVGNSLMTLLGSILEFDNPKQYALFVYTMYHLSTLLTSLSASFQYTHCFAVLPLQIQRRFGSTSLCLGWIVALGMRLMLNREYDNGTTIVVGGQSFPNFFPDAIGSFAAFWLSVLATILVVALVIKDEHNPFGLPPTGNIDVVLVDNKAVRISRKSDPGPLINDRN